MAAATDELEFAMDAGVTCRNHSVVYLLGAGQHLLPHFFFRRSDVRRIEIEFNAVKIRWQRHAALETRLLDDSFESRNWRESV